MIIAVNFTLDCKTVRIFAYSSQREQSNERSGTRLKTESETGERACEARALRACKTLTPRFTDFLTDFEKKPTVLQSSFTCAEPNTTVSKITFFAPTSAFLSYKQNWVKTFKKSNSFYQWCGIKFCQSLWGDCYEGPKRVNKTRNMAAAALGKLTGLVFEKPGKKFFGT